MIKKSIICLNFICFAMSGYAESPILCSKKEELSIQLEYRQIEAVDKEKSVSPVSSIVLKEVVDILSNCFNTKIQVGSIIQLSEQERRNLILRINIQNPSAGVPKV